MLIDRNLPPKSDPVSKGRVHVTVPIIGKTPGEFGVGCDNFPAPPGAIAVRVAVHTNNVWTVLNDNKPIFIPDAYTRPQWPLPPGTDQISLARTDDLDATADVLVYIPPGYPN